MQTTCMIEKNSRQYIQYTTNDCHHYSIKMQLENKIKSFLQLSKDIDSKILYDVTDLVSLKDYFVEKGASLQNIIELMEAVAKVRKEAKEYLIREDYIIFQEDLIFTDEQFSNVYFMIMYDHTYDSSMLTKLFKYIVGNYFITGNIKEIRLREDWLTFLKEHEYNERKMKRIIENNNHLSMPKHVEHHKEVFDIKACFKKLFVAREPMNHTCIIKNIEGSISLTNICDVSKKIFLSNDELVINRTMLSKQFNINNKKIGRTHARIYMDNQQVYLFDLGSKNGSYINGERVDKKSPFLIEKGDIVAFADEEFIVC